VVDGSVLATNLIIKALEDVKAAGGGSIYFPAGIILTGGGAAWVGTCGQVWVRVRVGATLNPTP
jgi:hypothetical protein